MVLSNYIWRTWIQISLCPTLHNYSCLFVYNNLCHSTTMWPTFCIQFWCLWVIEMLIIFQIYCPQWEIIVFVFDWHTIRQFLNTTAMNERYHGQHVVHYYMPVMQGPIHYWTNSCTLQELSSQWNVKCCKWQMSYLPICSHIQIWVYIQISCNICILGDHLHWETTCNFMSNIPI